MKLSALEIRAEPPAGATLLRMSPASRAMPGEGRSITFVASDPSVGRDQHRIAADAWQTANFMRNPVVLFAHDDSAPPIGRVTALRNVGDQLRATVEYADRDTYEFADTIYRLIRGNFLNAVSTGWIPISYRAANDRSRPGGLDFTKVELLAWISQTPLCIGAANQR